MQKLSALKVVDAVDKVIGVFESNEKLLDILEKLSKRSKVEL